MADKVELSTFPSNRIDALTMLYLEKQNLSEITPEELVDQYLKIRERIVNQFKENQRVSAVRFF
jgi:glutamine synthetase